MNEMDRLTRNTLRLLECDPVAARRFRALITLMENDDEKFRPRIQEAWRSAKTHEQQLAAGTSTSSWSQHMATGPNGEKQSLAIDLLDDDYPVPGQQDEWPESFRRYLLKLAVYSKGLTLRTGILWKLKPLPRRTLADAIEAENFAYSGPIGFDPTHVEVADVTYPEGERGVRPHAD